MEHFNEDDAVEIIAGPYLGLEGKIWKGVQNDFYAYMVDLRPHHPQPVEVKAGDMRLIRDRANPV